jgi:hypothetical protein
MGHITGSPTHCIALVTKIHLDKAITLLPYNTNSFLTTKNTEMVQGLPTMPMLCCKETHICAISGIFHIMQMESSIEVLLSHAIN